MCHPSEPCVGRLSASKKKPGLKENIWTKPCTISAPKMGWSTYSALSTCCCTSSHPRIEGFKTQLRDLVRPLALIMNREDISNLVRTLFLHFFLLWCMMKFMIHHTYNTACGLILWATRMFYDSVTKRALGCQGGHDASICVGWQQDLLWSPVFALHTHPAMI